MAARMLENLPSSLHRSSLRQLSILWNHNRLVAKPSLSLRENNRFRLHAVALGAEDASIDLAIDPAGVTTGAHVLPDAKLPIGVGHVRVPVARLDTLLAAEIVTEDRCLLKLDLQGWELEALKGADRILDRIEVILTRSILLCAGLRTVDRGVGSFS